MVGRKRNRGGKTAAIQTPFMRGILLPVAKRVRIVVRGLAIAVVWLRIAPIVRLAVAAAIRLAVTGIAIRLTESSLLTAVLKRPASQSTEQTADGSSFKTPAALIANDAACRRAEQGTGHRPLSRRTTIATSITSGSIPAAVIRIDAGRKRQGKKHGAESDGAHD